jgi:hypothetical protein
MRGATIAAAAAVALLVSGLLDTPAARAGDLATVVCLGSDAASYSPGLRDFSQTVTFASTPEGHSCTGLGKISGDDSFTGNFTGTFPLSCTSLLGPVGVTQVFTWSPSGRTSTWAASSVEVTYLAGQQITTFTGRITAGDYTGANLTDVEAFPSSALTACFSWPGLTHTMGLGTWTFTGL